MTRFAGGQYLTEAYAEDSRDATKSAPTIAAIANTPNVAVASPTFASSGGSLPWEGPLEQIQHG